MYVQYPKSDICINIMYMVYNAENGAGQQWLISWLWLGWQSAPEATVSRLDKHTVPTWQKDVAVNTCTKPSFIVILNFIFFVHEERSLYACICTASFSQSVNWETADADLTEPCTSCRILLTGVYVQLMCLCAWVLCSLLHQSKFNFGAVQTLCNSICSQTGCLPL